ncbi:MAG: hypothetical protein AAFZ46_12270 [Pseudomonadota bacterium]
MANETEAALSTSPLRAVRRMQEDIGRAVSDARERGVTDPQIELRLREWAESIKHTMEQG